MEAFVTCPNNTHPHVRAVAKGLDSDFRVVWKYRSDVWGWYWTRVDTGRYKVTTTARCGSKKSQRVEVVDVKRKTSKTTISRQEFRRIKRGMTRSRIRKIVGYPGAGDQNLALLRPHDVEWSRRRQFPRWPRNSHNLERPARMR